MKREILHFPIPRTSTSLSIIVSSDSLTISSAFNRPSANRALKSRTYSTFLPLNPAERISSGAFVRTSRGVGKKPCGGFPSSFAGGVKSRMNFRVMLLAAAPETC